MPADQRPRVVSEGWRQLIAGPSFRDVHAIAPRARNNRVFTVGSGHLQHVADLGVGEPLDLPQHDDGAAQRVERRQGLVDEQAILHHVVGVDGEA